MSDEEFERLKKELNNQETKMLWILYARHSENCIENLCRKYNAEHSIAGDCFFKAFFLVFEKKVRSNKYVNDSLGGFLFRVSRNIYLKYLEKEKGNQEKLIDYNYLDRLLRNFDNPEDLKQFELDELKRYRAYKKGIEIIGEKCRNLILRFFFDGKKIPELKKEFGFKNKNTTSVRKSECLEELRKIINEILESNNYG